MMNGKVVVTALVGIALLALFLPVRLAQAGIEPVLMVDHIYAALNSGDLDTAVASFAEDATAENLVRKETYSGENEIRQMLQGRQREGRRYEIVKSRWTAIRLRRRWKFRIAVLFGERRPLKPR
jgi:nuclear transport factor 2 (NTF2) superfamily protein